MERKGGVDFAPLANIPAGAYGPKNWNIVVWTIQIRMAAELRPKNDFDIFTYPWPWPWPLTFHPPKCTQMIATWSTKLSREMFQFLMGHCILSKCGCHACSALTRLSVHIVYYFYGLLGSDKGGGLCFCPCSFVCLLARLLKNACMDLDETLRVDRCRDMDESVFFTYYRKQITEQVR